MRISDLLLSNFKRFHSLSLREIPESAKLILIVGPNGSGKSSIFDALYHWYRLNSFGNVQGDENYFRKIIDVHFNWHDSVTVNFHGPVTASKDGLYLRTAYRNDPDFSTDNFNRPTPPTASLRLERLIENDAAVSQNYQRLVYDSLSALYNESNSLRTTGDVRDELIGEIRASMKRVFGDLELNNLADPLQAGTFYFKKGAINAYHYKNLSGGEKAAFDLLLDLHVKRKFYQNSIYCIDEIETHLHTRIQGLLLKELFETVPEKSQLWITTHSLGVMRAAQEIAKNAPDSVAVFDFSGHNFDEPQVLTPVKINRIVWEKFLSIALDDLSLRIVPKAMVLCEGTSTGKRRKDFDADIFNHIFNSSFPELLFLSGGNAAQVVAGAPTLQQALTGIAPSAAIKPLIDRDDLSPNEVADKKKAGTLVLSRRSLESYLFCDEVLAALALKSGKPNDTSTLVALRETALQASIARGNAADDYKSAAGDTYKGIKAALSLTACGNDTESFMRDTLAPLITPAMLCYQELKRDIVNSFSF